MKNYGRLDINDLDSEHIKLDNTNLNYSGDILKINGINDVHFNSEGEGHLLINSKGIEGTNSISLNSNNVKNTNNQYNVSINSTDSQVLSKILYLNSKESNLKGKISIGNNNQGTFDYVFGFKNVINGNNTNSFLIGNNIAEYNYQNNIYKVFILSNGGTTKNSYINDSLIIPLNSYDVNLTNNGLIYRNDGNYTLDKNLILPKNNYSGIEYNNRWNLNIVEGENEANSKIFKDSKLDNNSLKFYNNSIVYGYNKNEINNSIIIDNTSYGSDIFTKGLNNSIILSNGTQGTISADLQDAVLMNPNDKNNYYVSGKNALFINSSFKINVSGLEVDKDNYLTYDYLSILSNVDNGFGDMINRVYGKTAPSSQYSDTLIKDTLEDTLYKDKYLEIDINVNTFTPFIEIIDNSSQFNGYVADITNVTESVNCRLFIKNTKVYVDSLNTKAGSDCKFEYAVAKNSTNTHYYIKIANAKNKKFIVKFCAYSMYTPDIFKNLNLTKYTSTTTQEFNFVEPLSRGITYLNYNQSNKAPSQIVYRDGNFKNYYVDNDLSATNIQIHDLSGYYGDLLNMYILNESGNYKTDVMEYVKDEGNRIIDKLSDAQSYSYIPNNTKKYEVDEHFYDIKTNLVFPYMYTTLDNASNDFISISTLNDGYDLNKNKNIDLLASTPNVSGFYGKGETYIYKWGAMANFYYQNESCEGNANDFITHFTTEQGTEYSLFIPFICVPESYYNLIFPIAQDSINIKVNIDGEMHFAYYCYHPKIKFYSVSLGPALLSICRDKFYQEYFGYQNCIGYTKPDSIFNNGKKRRIYTETITYMTQVFNMYKN